MRGSWSIKSFVVGAIVSSAGLFGARMLHRENQTIPDIRVPQSARLMRHIAFIDWLGKHRPQVAFLGDSITDLWSDYPDLWSEFSTYEAANFGISYDGCENVLWRVDQGELDASSIKVVVLLIGTNNLDHAPEEVASGISTLLSAIRSRPSHPRVLLLGLLPKGQSPDDPDRAKIQQINKLISPLADGRNVVYLNFGPKLLSPDGTVSAKVMPDYIHLGRQGYEIWANTTLPALKKMLLDVPATQP